MLLLIDNYDSFTYNLVQYFQCLHQTVQVFKNDAVTLEEIDTLNPTYIVISPGPRDPQSAGISLALIKQFHQRIPMLGICLGHQCLAQAFGGKIIQAPEIMHGKTSRIKHDNQGLFTDIPNHFQATRYHSLAVDPPALPACFRIDAWADDTIMAISHRQYPLFGLQFHPESILSEYGMQLLSNFIHYEHKTFI